MRRCHTREKRVRVNYRTGGHGTISSRASSPDSRARVYLFNKLSNCIKSAAMPMTFITRLKIALVSEEFHSSDEFRANNRDTLADKWQEWDIFE